MKQKTTYGFLSIPLYSLYFACWVLIALGGCRESNVRSVDNIPDEQQKGFVEFYLSDRFLKDPESDLFKQNFPVEVYQYKRKGTSRLYTETVSETLVIAKKPGRHTFFVVPRHANLPARKVVAKVVDKKITPVKIDISIGKTEQSTEIDMSFQPVSGDFVQHTKQFFKIKVTVFEPISVELQRAIENFSQAIGKNPEAVETYYKRANAYEIKGQYDRAISDLNKAIALHPMYVDAYLRRGLVFTLKSLHDNAISDFSKVITIDANRVEAYNHRGKAYRVKGQYELAASDFSQAIALNPKNSEAYGNRGTTWALKGRYDKAISDFDRAIALDPKNAEAYNGRGVAFEHTERYDKAISDFNQAISLNKGFAEAFLNRGNVYAKIGKHDNAVYSYNRALEINPDLVYIYYNRSRSYFITGQYQKAWDDLIKLRNLGLPIAPDYLEMLRKALAQ